MWGNFLNFLGNLFGFWNFWKISNIVILSLSLESEKSKEFKIHFKFMDCHARREPCSQWRTSKLCHFEPFAKRRKIQRNLRHALNLWILRQRLSMTKAVPCSAHFTLSNTAKFKANSHYSFVFTAFSAIITPQIRLKSA